MRSCRARRASQMRRPENIFKRAAGIAAHGARQTPIPIRRRIDWPDSNLATLPPPPTPRRHLLSATGVKKFWIWETGREEEAKVRRDERHIAANPITGGRGDNRRGFREALHLKSQAIAKQEAAFITRRKMLRASLKNKII